MCVSSAGISKQISTSAFGTSLTLSVNGDWSHQQQQGGRSGSAYRDGGQIHLTAWCANTNLALTTENTKELIVDYR